MHTHTHVKRTDLVLYALDLHLFKGYQRRPQLGGNGEHTLARLEFIMVYRLAGP